MKDKKTLDYLPNTNIYLYQRKDMFRMNTDTALLGGFMKVYGGETVLDIGTNNGALLLYANLQHPRHLYGIDILEEACILARNNMKYQDIKNVTIVHGDVKGLQLDPVDVIVCNPPYFKVGEQANVNESEKIRCARHEIYLTLESLFMSVDRLLKDNGRFYLVHRSDRLSDIICGLRDIHMEVKKIQFIYDEQKDDARSVLLEAVKQGKSHCIVMKPHIVTR